MDKINELETALTAITDQSGHNYDLFVSNTESLINQLKGEIKGLKADSVKLRTELSGYTQLKNKVISNTICDECVHYICPMPAYMYL